MFDERNVGETCVEAMHEEMRQRAKMYDNRIIDEACVEAMSSEVRQIAIDTFGDKLDKLYLYEVNPGGREDPDLSFLVVLNVSHEEVYDEWRKFRDNRGGLGLKHDVLYYTQITNSEIFNKNKYSTADFRIAVDDGVLLYG